MARSTELPRVVLPAELPALGQGEQGVVCASVEQGKGLVLGAEVELTAGWRPTCKIDTVQIAEVASWEQVDQTRLDGSMR